MSSLISAAALLEMLDDVVVIDVSFALGGPPGREFYDAGHVPGAFFVDVETELSGPPGPGRHPLPMATVVEAALRRCGVSADTQVVVHDQATSLSAARAWWILRYFGLPRVRVLDGGLAAWRAAGGEVVTEQPSPPAAGSFEAVPGGMPMLDAAGAAELARTGVLLDVRTPERYAGETEPIDPVAGHIPGAVNVPAADLLEPDGRFRPPDEIPVPAGSPVGAYCGSGITAAQAALALSEAGIQTAVYVGSWSDWITDPTRPIATGRP